MGLYALNQDLNHKYLNGVWEVYDVKSAIIKWPHVTKEEKNRCIARIIRINNDSIITSDDSCFIDELTCNNPSINRKRLATSKYFEEDPFILEQLNYNKDSIDIIHSNCEMPFTDVIMLDPNHFVLNLDGFLLFLKKRMATKNGFDDDMPFVGHSRAK